MYYLYTLDSARVLHKVVENGHHVCNVNKEKLLKQAAALSLQNSGVPYTIDKNGYLHNTRDGKPLTDGGLSPVYRTC